MGGRLAAEAVKRFLPRVKTVIPCHYGTFPIIEATPTPSCTTSASTAAGRR
jgi:L-ascorbate metabolism protein UlaG (beta-lactamase superfamily)